MNPAHVHLVLTHFPIAGLFFSLLLLAIAKVRRSQEWIGAGLLLLVFSAVLCIPLYLSGEGAEEVAEHISGVSRHDIHEHEEAAEKALVAILVLGSAALAALVWCAKKGTFPQRAVNYVFLLGVFVFALVAWTANLGGSIRHTEIHQNEIH